MDFIKNKDVFTLKGLFVLYFEVILICRAMGPFLLLPHIVDTILFWSAALIGVIFILYDFFEVAKKKTFSRYNWLLIAFLVCMVISSLLNLKYGFFGNAKLIMWQAIFFLVVYQFSKDYGYNRFFEVFETILIFSWFLAIAISLGMFVTGYGIKIPIEFKYYPVRLGFLGNRLFGVFTDPNFGAVMSLVVILFSIKQLVQKIQVNKYMRIFTYVNILLQFIFIVLSGSRTALICLLLVGFVFCFFSVFSSRKLLKFDQLKKIAISFTLAILSISLVYGGTVVVGKTVTKVPAIFHSIIGEQHHKVRNKIEDKDDDIGDVSLDRPDTKSDNISNARFELWSSAFEIFKKRPIFGASAGNYIAFAHDKLPHTFMGQDTRTAHNLFFLVLASTGGVGTLIFFLFFFIMIYKAVIFCFTHQSNANSPIFYCILSCLAISVSSMFITELVLVSTIGSLVFWLFVGLMDREKA